MKNLLAILLLPFFLCSCLATSGDIERAVADFTGRIDVVARDSQQSAQAVRDAYARGEITAAELDKRLQDVTAATLEAGKETAVTVLKGVTEAIEQRPAEAIETAGKVAGSVLPGPWGEIAAIVAAAAAAAYAKKRGDEAERKSEDTKWDIEHERVKALAEAKK